MRLQRHVDYYLRDLSKNKDGLLAKGAKAKRLLCPLKRVHLSLLNFNCFPPFRGGELHAAKGKLPTRVVKTTGIPTDRV